MSKYVKMFSFKFVNIVLPFLDLFVLTAKEHHWQIMAFITFEDEQLNDHVADIIEFQDSMV